MGMASDSPRETIRYSFFPRGVTAFTTTRGTGRDYGRIAFLAGVERENVIAPHQTHTDRILRVGSGFPGLPEEKRKEKLEGTDALFTDLRGVLIGVSTADCVPVLLYDGGRKAVAAVHAGWRGTLLRIAEKTVREMGAELGTNPEDIMAVIGPAISLRRFEVGDEVYEAFVSAGFDTNLLAVKKEKWHIDLQEANRLELVSAGVPPENIHTERICTYERGDILFSARREQRGTEKCGRNFNAIMLDKN